MNRKRIIRELTSTQKVKAQCPHCEETFPLSRAIVFDAAEELPEQAVEFLQRKEVEFREENESLKEMSLDLKQRKHSATKGAETKATEIGVGLVLEKIITGWKQFPHRPGDCRSLFEPIDYIAFDGMTQQEKIESIAFLDIKTGGSKLNKNQRLIRDAINEGRVDYKEV